MCVRTAVQKIEGIPRLRVCDTSKGFLIRMILRSLFQLPAHHIARMPVDNSHQHPSPRKPDVCYVGPIDVVRILSCDVSQQVRIDPVLESLFTEIGAGVDLIDPPVRIHSAM